MADFSGAEGMVASVLPRDPTRAALAPDREAHHVRRSSVAREDRPAADQDLAPVAADGGQWSGGSEFDAPTRDHPTAARRRRRPRRRSQRPIAPKRRGGPS